MLLLASPLIFLKLPWLPATVQSFIEAASESTANGTPSFVKDHTETLWRQIEALALYAVGLWAILGLARVAVGRCKHPAAQAATWLSIVLVGVTLPIFEAPSIAPITDRDYVFLVVYLPISLAVLAAGALTAQAVFFLRRKS